MNTRSVDTDIKSPEALRAWAEEIELEIAQITASIVPLQQRLDASREKLDLVRRLIHLSSAQDAQVPTSAEAIRSTQLTSPPAIEDHIEEILRGRGEPMHIREIRSCLVQKGVPLPGRGDEANIILRLRRASDRFVRSGRGMYALVAWEVPEYSPAARTKKVQRRKRARP